MKANHTATDVSHAAYGMLKSVILTVALFLFFPAFMRAQETDQKFLQCKKQYETLLERLKQDETADVKTIYELVDLSKDASMLDRNNKEAQCLYKKILTLRGNYSAKCGNYDEMLATATLYEMRFGEDETGKRFKEYVEKLVPPFIERVNGYWVTSHRDMSGAPMLAMYISIDEANGDYSAFIDPNCNLYNSAAYKNALSYLSTTKGVEYKPSKKTLTLTFMGGKLKSGNTELGQSISKSTEEISSKTTEGLATANRDKPLSGKNVLGQTLSESFGSIGQGIARELSVTKTMEYYVTMKMSEVSPGVMKVIMDYNSFVNRSDGDSYMDDFVRREFYLYKVSMWDRPQFSSKYGNFMSANYAGDNKAYSFDQKLKTNDWEMVDIENRLHYLYKKFYEPEKTETLNYYDEFGKPAEVDWGEVFYEMDSNRNLYYTGVYIPFKVDKDAYYKGAYRFKKDPDFFDSPMFLLPILEQFDDEDEEIAGVRYKYQQIYDRDHKKYLNKFMDIVEPRYGIVNYVDKKNNDRSYRGYFQDYKFHGEGKIYDDFNAKGNVIEEGEYKNGKLQK